MDEIVAQGLPAGHGDAADANQDGTATRSEKAAYDEAQKGNEGGPNPRPSEAKRSPKRGPSSTTPSPKRRGSAVIVKKWIDFLRDHKDANATSKAIVRWHAQNPGLHDPMLVFADFIHDKKYTKLALYMMLNHDTEGAQGRDNVISPGELEHAVKASRRWGGHDATTKSDSNAIQLNPAQQHEVFDRLCGPLKPKETRGFTYKQFCEGIDKHHQFDRHLYQWLKEDNRKTTDPTTDPMTTEPIPDEANCVREKERLAKEIDELKKKINAMEVAQEKEEREFRKEKNRLSDESEELLSTMQSKIRKLEVSKQQEVEFEKDSSKALKEKVSEMALEVEKAKVRTARAESELTVIKETHATRVTELQQLAAQEDPDAAKQLLALQKENDELKVKLRETGSDNAAIERQLKDLRHEQKLGAAESGTVGAELAAARAQNTVLQQTISDLKQELAEQKHATQKLITEEREVEQVRAAAYQQSNSEQVVELKQLLADQKAETKELKSELKETNDSLSESRMESLRSSALDASRTSEGEQNSAEILVELGHLRGQYDGLAQQLTESIGAAAAQTARAEEAAKTLHEVRTEFNNAKVENERLRGEVERAGRSEQEAKLLLHAAEENLQASHVRHERAEDRHDRVVEERREAEARHQHVLAEKHEVEKTVVGHISAVETANARVDRQQLDHEAEILRVKKEHATDKAAMNSEHSSHVDTLKTSQRELESKVELHTAEKKAWRDRRSAAPKPFRSPDFDGDDDPSASSPYRGIGPELLETKTKSPTKVVKVKTRGLALENEVDDHHEDEMERRILASVAEQIALAEKELELTMLELTEKDVELESYHQDASQAQALVVELTEQVSELTEQVNMLEAAGEAAGEAHADELYALRTQCDDIGVTTAAGYAENSRMLHMQVEQYESELEGTAQTLVDHETIHAIVLEQRNDCLTAVTVARESLTSTFGFALSGMPEDTSDRHVVSTIVAGGVADGKLIEDDEFVSINGRDLAGLSHEETIQTIRQELVLDIRVLRRHQPQAQVPSGDFNNCLIPSDENQWGIIHCENDEIEEMAYAYTLSDENDEIEETGFALDTAAVEHEEDEHEANAEPTLSDENDRIEETGFVLETAAIEREGATRRNRVCDAEADFPRRDVLQDKRNSIHGNEWNDMSISCWYVGTFEVGKANKIDKNEVKRGIHSMKEYIKNQREATLVICLEGMKVVDTTSNKVAMAHALSRVSMAAADSQLPLFGFVAKNPGVPDKFCHVFNMNSRAHAEHLQGLVMQAFKLAFANERQEKGSKQAPKAAPPPAAQARQWAKHNPLPGLSGGDRPQQHRPSGQPAARSITQAAQQAAAQQPQQPQQPKPKAAGGGRNADGSALPQDSSGPIPKAGGSKATSIENAAWFQAGVPREIAMELLEMSEDGAFVVRDSSSQPGNYALTLKGDGLMHHFIIRKVPQGYVLGSEAQGQSPFGDLGSLIVNYASTPGCLPCCLSLDSFNQVYKEQDDVQSEHSFVDPDYQDLVQLMGKR